MNDECLSTYVVLVIGGSVLVEFGLLENVGK